MNRASVLLLMTVAVFAPACDLGSHRHMPGLEAVSTRLAWPPPPSPPRVRFVQTVARPADLGIRPGFWQRVGEIVLGREEQRLVRPTGVAVARQTIYVADPGAQALWILNSEAGRVRRIRDAGPQPLVSPVAVTVAGGDRIYLADSFLARVFVYDAAGDFKGAITAASLQRPAGLAYDRARARLYVADSAAHRVWIFAGGGQQLGAIGRRGTGDGEFNFPTHVAVGRDGTVYVTDGLGFRIEFFTPDGAYAGQFGRLGDTSGDFARPKGVALDSEDHVYVVETLFDTVQIFDRRGQLLLNFGERGFGPGQFWLPGGLFIDDRDRIYVADAYNQRIQVFQYLATDNDG